MQVITFNDATALVGSREKRAETVVVHQVPHLGRWWGRGGNEGLRKGGSRSGE